MEFSKLSENIPTYSTLFEVGNLGEQETYIYLNICGRVCVCNVTLFIAKIGAIKQGLS